MRTHIFPLTAAALLAASALAPGEDAAPPKEAPLNTEYLRQHAATRGFLLGRPSRPKISPDGKTVLFLRSKARVPKLDLYEFSVADGKTRELLTPEQVLKGAEEHLSPEEKARRERQRVSVGGFTDYQLSEDGGLVLLSLSGKLYVYHRGQAAVKELATGPGTILDPKFSPDGKMVAYVRDHDVCVYDLATGKESPVTKGGTEKKPHGLAEFVAQEEMNRYSGYWWSPDSKSIAYQETDHEGVEIWYVSDPANPGRQPEAQYYPRPGKANARVRLGVVPLTGGDTVWVDWDRQVWEYLAHVRWDRLGGLAITLQDRKQQWMTLLKVNPATGETTELASQHSDTWVNIDPSVPRWLTADSFLWTVNGELSLYEEGRPRQPLLQGPGYRGLVSVDEKARAIVYLSTWQNQSAETGVYRVTLARDGRNPIGVPQHLPAYNGLGQYGAALAKDHSLYVLSATTPGQMPRSTVYRANGDVVGELPSVAEEPPFKPNVSFGHVGPYPSFATAIVLPRDFDRKKKYPVIVDVYGGPGHQQVVAAMRNWLLPQWLADQGFIVVSVDNRGTPGREQQWEKVLYQEFGSVPLDDQVTGLKGMAGGHPQMDLGRVGIVGWSFGGYMSALAVLRRPDIFKAAVAGAPVTDWEDYDTHYTERYLGLLPESARAYQRSSLLPLAAKLERPLLLVHGTADDNVYFRHTLRLTDALFRAGKDFEVLPLPSLTHMVPDPEVTERLWARQVRFFQNHLGRPLDQPPMP
jgi:dipeptidyl-peptidase-4